jgi:hypothetical protein
MAELRDLCPETSRDAPLRHPRLCLRRHGRAQRSKQSGNLAGLKLTCGSVRSFGISPESRVNITLCVSVRCCQLPGRPFICGLEVTLLDRHPRATTAAPTYFPPVEVQPADATKSYALVDRGMDAGNPAMCAYAEAIKMMGKAGAKS